MPGAIGNAGGVDLNSASEQELERVGGLGRERAQRIIQQRPFNSWDDVKKIEGFSDTLVNDLRQAGASIGGKRAANCVPPTSVESGQMWGTISTFLFRLELLLKEGITLPLLADRGQWAVAGDDDGVVR